MDTEKYQVPLKRLYGEKMAEKACKAMRRLFNEKKHVEKKRDFDQKDLILITYGDSIKMSGENPLKTLKKFYDNYLSELFPVIHILPFFPYSSDDGFSITDYTQVRNDLGDWEDIENFTKQCTLMCDLVLNHISANSGWMYEFLHGSRAFTGLAVEYIDDFDYSHVVRPRTTPLFTSFGSKKLWTTFGPDQVDINYSLWENLLRMLGVLAFYLDRGIRGIRLDAVGFVWKVSGTSCMSLPGTHDVVKIIKTFMKDYAPDSFLITETNVPHEENISYFGNHGSEADAVYNFSLPPLLLHALFRGSAVLLRQWVRTNLKKRGDRMFFNFTASHDGIGLRPLEGLVSQYETEELIGQCRNAGAMVSYREKNGKKIPYEINCTYIDAANAVSNTNPGDPRPFLVSQAAALFIPGIPGIYINSLLGIRNWEEGVKRLGRARLINRYKSGFDDASIVVNGEQGEKSLIFSKYAELIKIRRQCDLFSPLCDVNYPSAPESVFAVLRKKGKKQALVLINFSSSAVDLGSFWNEHPFLKVTKQAVLLPSYGIQLYFSEGFNNISVDSDFLQI